MAYPALVASLQRDNKHMRDGLELVLCMETPVPNGTTKKIMRTVENALTGKPFDV
jgi:hypothetical protein